MVVEGSITVGAPSPRQQMFGNTSGLTERFSVTKKSPSSSSILPHQQAPVASSDFRGQKRGALSSELSRWSLRNLRGWAIVSLVTIVVLGSGCQLEHVANPGQPSIFQIGWLLTAYIRGANPVLLKGSFRRRYCGNSYEHEHFSANAHG